LHHTLAPGQSLEKGWSLEQSGGWYSFTVGVESDSSFKQQLAGHIETGNDSITDPAIAPTSGS
jgi:phospholipase C